MINLNNHQLLIDYHPEHSSLNEAIYERISLFVKPAKSILKPLRLVKTPEEQELLRKSCKIASEAFTQVKPKRCNNLIFLFSQLFILIKSTMKLN